jgi:hypothetical protein
MPCSFTGQRNRVSTCSSASSSINVKARAVWLASSGFVCACHAGLVAVPKRIYIHAEAADRRCGEISTEGTGALRTDKLSLR